MLIVSFADRDMVMRHFGFGIGHSRVNFDACQRNNEDDLGSDSDSESDAMDSKSRASDLENSKVNDDLKEDSDRDSESSLASTSSATGGSGSSGLDTQSDDDGYASF